MNTLEAIAKRVSVRKYKSEQVPNDILEQILKAGMAAPVGTGAYNALHITVIQDGNILSENRQCCYRNDNKNAWQKNG